MVDETHYYANVNLVDLKQALSDLASRADSMRLKSRPALERELRSTRAARQRLRVLHPHHLSLPVSTCTYTVVATLCCLWEWALSQTSSHW